MKKNNSILIPVQRQPLGAIFILAQNSFRGLIGQFWPILLVALLNRSPDRGNFWFMLAAIVLGALSFIISIIGYFRFSFSIENDEIIIEQGVFTRVRTAVPFRRVQSINFEQKLLHRMLGLVSFKIDTAGSEQSEITIPAIQLKTANEMRDLVLEQKRFLAATDPDSMDDHPEFEAPKTLFRLTIKDLLKVGVSVNHIRTMGIILGLVWVIYVETNDVFEEIVDTALEYQDVPTAGPDSWMYFAILVVVLFIISFLTSLVLTCLRYYNLKVFSIADGLKVVSGLLNRKEQTAKRKKTQVMTWVTNPIRRIFGMYNVRLKQASSAEVNASQAIVIPGCYAHQVDDLKSYYFGSKTEEHFEFYGIRREIVIRYTLYFGLLPAIALGAILFLNVGFTALFTLTWIPVAYFLFHIYHQKFRFGLSKLMLYSQRGTFGLRMDMMELHKIQSVSIRQTPYLQRRDLANLHIQTASGKIIIPYLYLDFAQKIMDLMLYRVETSRKHWM